MGVKDSVEGESACGLIGLQIAWVSLMPVLGHKKWHKIALEKALRTLMVHVSSVSKSTMDSPPLASSALFGGRNRATTRFHYQHDSILKMAPFGCHGPLIVLPEAPLVL